MYNQCVHSVQLIDFLCTCTDIDLIILDIFIYLKMSKGIFSIQIFSIHMADNLYT